MFSLYRNYLHFSHPYLNVVFVTVIFYLCHFLQEALIRVLYLRLGYEDVQFWWLQKLEYQNRTVATGGCKIGIEKSDVKKSESFKQNGCRRGGLNILNYYNNVPPSMDGHCYFCTCMPLYYLHETCCGNPEHCLKSNFVLFGILDEDKKLSFKYFNDTTSHNLFLWHSF